MTHSKFHIISLLFLLFSFQFSASAAIGIQELADSLTSLTGFSPVWFPPVKVKSLRVNGNNIAVYTNNALSGVRWTKEEVYRYNLKVSQWLLGNNKGKVTIYTNRQAVNELITNCARGIHSGAKGKDLSNRNIALWPSHGLYHNPARDEWIWQRATLWTTVEDLYSQEYVRLIRQMLENAGASIYMPRAGLEHGETGLSGMPRWAEGARYWVEAQGADSTLWYLFEGDEYKDDMKSRPMWVNALEDPIDLCLALHTDGVDSGDDSTVIGTLCIYTAFDDEGNRTLRDGRNRQTVNRNLADHIQTQITQDLRRIAPEWTRRQLMEANYCESRVPVVPSVLVELVSHKNMADMRYGLDPRFRFTAARAIYKGILRYLNGPSSIVQPLPIQDMQILASGKMSWTPVLDSSEPSAKPTYYMVYIRQNDGEWDVQQVTKPTYQLPMQPGVRYDCYVVAGNEGGLSLPGPTLSAYRNAQTPNGPMVNIIDAFSDTYGPEWFGDSIYAGIVPGSYACEDRFTCAYIGEQWDFTRSHPWTDDDNCGWGACYRDHAGQFTIGNTRDYALMHGRVLQQMGISYVSTTAGSMNKDLAPFTIIDYIAGRQLMPVDSSMQMLLEDYLSQGGKLLLSSDHLSRVPNEWLKEHLHVRYHASHATRSGRVALRAPFAASPTRPLTINLKPNEHQLFSPSPEGIQPIGENAFSAATYLDMRCPAAVGYSDEQLPVIRTLVFSFPLEAVTNFESIYTRSIQWLLQ